jgi:hypothetical protein
MARFNTGLELEGMSSGSIKTRLKQVGLKPENLAEIVDLIPQSLFDCEAESAPASGG